MSDDIRLPKAELDKFLSQDIDIKRDAKEWGKRQAKHILDVVRAGFTGPIWSMPVHTRPTRTSKRFQTAKAYSRVGGARVTVQFWVEEKGGPTLQVWVQVNLKPAVRRGWLHENKAIVEPLVAKYSAGRGRCFVGKKRANTHEFSLLYEFVDADLIIPLRELAELAEDFEAMITAVMRETLEHRHRLYRDLRAIIPADVATRDLAELHHPILERAAVVRALLAAMNSRPLVLLAGVSGTGKTQLAKRIGLARALGMLQDLDEKDGSIVDRQFQALIPEVIQPIDDDWVWVIMPDEGSPVVENNEDGDTDDDDEDEDAEMDPEDLEEGDEEDDDAAVEQDSDLGLVDRFALVPVQADWKEASSLWGWYHPLEPACFHASPVLRVFLDASERAARNLPVSHVVVLDEMNLSRIEHYGSDLLSAMENPGQEMIALHRIGKPVPMSGDSGRLIPPATAWPEGVVVIGTVNVDETTFSFAPKVLDRAAVLEFVDVDLKRYFEETGQSAEWSKLGGWFEAIQEATRPFSLHLGYRAAREIVTVLKAELGNDASTWIDTNLTPVLDGQLRNKVLPRVRGPRGTAEPALIALLALAVAGVGGAKAKQDELAELALAGWPPDEVAKLRNGWRSGSAAEKAWQMLLRLRDVGFTGFF